MVCRTHGMAAYRHLPLLAWYDPMDEYVTPGNVRQFLPNPSHVSSGAQRPREILGIVLRFVPLGQFRLDLTRIRIPSVLVPRG